MHVTSGVELSHGGVDNGKACLSFLPSFQVLIIVFPLNLVEFLLEGVVRFGLLKHFWMIVGDVDVEVSPVKLVDDVVLRAQVSQSCLIGLPDGNGSKVKVSSETSAGNRRVVSIFVVVFEILKTVQNL